jgi:hypothetical protein
MLGECLLKALDALAFSLLLRDALSGTSKRLSTLFAPLLLFALGLLGRFASSLRSLFVCLAWRQAKHLVAKGRLLCRLGGSLRSGRSCRGVATQLCLHRLQLLHELRELLSHGRVVGGWRHVVWWLL